MGLSSKQVVSGVGDLQDWPNLQPEPIKAPQLQPATTTAQKRQAMVLDPAPPALRCPRCDSTNTKFCYYNNYSRTQPRYLCKACKRHWTSGGTLRNVPVGGSRKTKRPRTAPTSDAAATTKCGISVNANNNGSSSPPSSSILHQPAPIVQHPFLPYSSLMDVPELDYLGGGGSALTGTSGAANLAHLFSLPPLSLPFSTAALGSFLDLASNSCSGGDASFATTPSLSPFFPFIMQPDTSSTTAAALVTDVNTSDPVSNAPSSAWQSTTTGLLLPIVSADDSSSPNVLSPPIASGSASGSCGGMMMTAPWIDDFAGLISTYQQPQDYHHL